MTKGNYFDGIEQEITHLQRRMAELRAENMDLRQQLTNLRNGHGIHIEIAGKAFSFASNASEALTEDTAPARALPEQIAIPPVAQQPTSPPTSSSRDASASTPTPTPKNEKQHEGKKNEARPSTFLEEIMLDEFAAAASTPLAVWTGPAQKQEPISEGQKEALRRELMGSFLLE